MTARNTLIDRLFRKEFSMTKPCIDNLLEELFDNPPHYLDQKALREACADNDLLEIGSIVMKALEKCAESYCDSEKGQDQIRDIEMEEEESRRLDMADYERSVA